MPQCAVLGCNSSHRKTKGGLIRYHRFPGDSDTRARWVQACGKTVQNCSTARICSLHFTDECYERDVQHELLGLPTRCRLKKGATPLRNLPNECALEETGFRDSAIAVLLAVGLVPAGKEQKVMATGGMPQDLSKMQMMENVNEACSIQPSSPGHAEESNTDTNPTEPSELKASNGEAEEAPKESPDEIKEEKVPFENGKSSLNPEENSTSSSEENSNNKRKSSGENHEDLTKRLRLNIQESFLSRDRILNDFLELAADGGNNLEQLQLQTEQILAEIQTLNELAKEKEREWNNIIHLKKMKEELLLRMQRKKQVLVMNGGEEANCTEESQRNQSILKANLTKTLKKKHKDYELNNGLDSRPVKQRPVLDVQSIIADYRQRHPEVVPRRGRRIRNDKNLNNHILNLSSMMLGSGAQVHQNLDSNEFTAQESSSEPSFKEMLVQFAKLSQSERQEFIQNVVKPPPPPYPEVTVHPITTTTVTNSLLHGILTKSPNKGNTKTAFSPTLARLLTAPERDNSFQATATTNNNAANMSISEILSTNKARNEITITPVGNQFEASHEAAKTLAQDEDETGDSADRLVIDESIEVVEARRGGDNNSDAGDEVPQCQGCNQKSALFVCAGCGNQWYCSRNCQVLAWDEHSEVCSG